MQRLAVMLGITLAATCWASASDGVYVGIETQDIDQAQAADTPTKGKGAIVVSVTPESPAAKGGVMPGDLIYKMGSAWVRQRSDVTKWEAEAEPDVEASVFLFRRGATNWERKKVTVVPMSAAAREQATKVTFAENSDAAKLHGLAGVATPEARQAIQEILAEPQPTPELMIAACEVLRNPSVDIRAEAISAIGKWTKEPEKIDATTKTKMVARLQAGSNDRDRAVRYYTRWQLHTLGGTPKPTPEPFMKPEDYERTLGDKTQSWLTRRMLMGQLRSKPDPWTVPIAAKRLNDDDWMVRQLALQILNYHPFEHMQQYRQALEDMLPREMTQLVRIELEKARGRFDPEGEHPKDSKLLIEWQKHDAMMRSESTVGASRAIEWEHSVVSDLVTAFKVYERKSSKSAPGSTVTRVLELTKHEHHAVRAGAAKFLEDSPGDVEAKIAALLPLLEDWSDTTRLNAVRTLRKIALDDPRVAAALKKLYHDPHEWVASLARTGSLAKGRAPKDE